MIDHRPKSFRKIFCVTPGCGQQGELLDHTSNGMAPALIEDRFNKKGWEVGRDSSEDYCPSCVATRQAERRAKRLKPVAIVELPTEETKEPEMPMNGAELPAGMTRLDRRIIHNKLEEVYESEEVGYKPGWTDLNVAKHLGQHVPVAWVALVREEAFGPVKDNEEIREMLHRVGEAATEAKLLVDSCKGHRKEVSALVDQNNRLMAQAGEINKKLDGLLAIADRIERMVKP